MRAFVIGFCLVAVLAGVGYAGEIVLQIHEVTGQGVGKTIGTVTAADNQYGLLLTPRLTGLVPGIHGFHVHQNADCGHVMKDGKGQPGMAAGGHYDPGKTDRHEGPYGQGHLGDLPPLFVTADGKAETPVLAPRLRTADLKGRSLMIHAGGDNYADVPEKLGGGGARVACGVIK